VCDAKYVVIHTSLITVRENRLTDTLVAEAVPTIPVLDPVLNRIRCSLDFNASRWFPLHTKLRQLLVRTCSSLLGSQSSYTKPTYLRTQ
jgi:hypothetical protein